MIHEETIRGLQDLISEIDREMARLRETLRQGDELRAELLRHVEALEQRIGNDR